MSGTTLSPKIHEILNKAVNGTIDNFVVSVHDPNKKGDGFLGEMFFVSLKDKSTGNQLHFAVKQAFSEQDIRDFHSIRDLFLTEIYFYTKVWTKFSSFQEQVPPENRFNYLPKHFAATTEENFERLVLENLKSQGFVIHKKTKPLEKEQFEFMFKIYGKLHAISFAYKVSNPEEFSELARGITDMWVAFTRKDHFQGIIKLIYKNCLKCLQPGVDDAVIEKFKHYVDDGVELFWKGLASGKYNAILHGDSWSNNVMLKYDDSGKLIDLRLVDFQMIRFASPVWDLSYCLYSGGTKEIFDRLDDLLQVYHDSFSESLRAYGCDPNKLYSMEALKNDWKEYCHLGVTMALIIWRGKFTTVDDVIDLGDTCDDEEGKARKFFGGNYDKESYRERIRDVIFHCYEKGYIV